MSEQMSVIINLSREKMDQIDKRAKELGVTTGEVASVLLESGVGVDALDRVRFTTPRLVVAES